MPQFDFDSFSTQVFWSLSGFFYFYFLVLRYYLSLIGEALKFRSKLVDSYSVKDKAQNTNLSMFDRILSLSK